MQVPFALLPRQQRLNFSLLDKQHAIIKVARMASDIVGAVGDAGDIEKSAANGGVVFNHQDNLLCSRQGQGY